MRWVCWMTARSITGRSASPPERSERTGLRNGDLTVTGATRGAAGPNLANANKATTFGGTDASYASSKTLEPSKDTLSIEAWFKTTSTSGGKIVGFGNSSTGNSGNYDRHIYMDGNGKVTVRCASWWRALA